MVALALGGFFSGGGREVRAGQRVRPAAQAASAHFQLRYPADGERRLAEEALQLLEREREELLRRVTAASLRFPEKGPFEVVFHASTSAFVAATGSAGLRGWATGVTRGRRIELQPMELLQRRGEFITALRHELAHGFIEILGQGRAPRWLAEGLAIYASGEGPRLRKVEIRPRLSLADLERGLAAPADVAEARRLYAQAYDEVQRLVRAEGEAAVWRRVSVAAAGPAPSRTGD